MSKKNLTKIKFQIGEAVQKVHDQMMKLKEQPEAASLQILSVPKSIDKPETVNIDFIIGQSGSPETVAEVMIMKAKIDLHFANFCQDLLVHLEKRMLEEGIEEKIQASFIKAEEVIEAARKEHETNQQ